MRRDNFDRLIESNNFQQLFIEELGWNNPTDTWDYDVEIDDNLFVFHHVADKNGFQVYTCEVESIPVASMCKKIDNKLRTDGHYYICIL